MRAQRGFPTRSEPGARGASGARSLTTPRPSTPCERSVASPREASRGRGGPKVHVRSPPRPPPQRAQRGFATRSEPGARGAKGAQRRRPPTRLRRERDSNPRYLSVHTISNRAPSATRTPLQAIRFVLSQPDPAPSPVNSVGGGRALPGRPHRGRSQEPFEGSCLVEERVGVEPTLDLRPNLISNQALSATQPPLRYFWRPDPYARRAGVSTAASGEGGPEPAAQAGRGRRRQVEPGLASDVMLSCRPCQPGRSADARARRRRKARSVRARRAPGPQRNGVDLRKAVDGDSGAQVALKNPHPQLESDVVFFERFKREEEMGQRLDHPNIVKVLKPREKSRMYIAMEYVDGTLAPQHHPGGRAAAG